MKKNSPKRLFHRIFYYFCSILSDETKANMNSSILSDKYNMYNKAYRHDEE